MNYEIYRVEWHSDAHLEYLENQYKLGNEPTGTLYGRDTETTRSFVRCNPIKTTKIDNFISFEWDDNKDKISTSFTYSTSEELNCGDWICLYNAKDDVDVMFGVITNKSYSDLYKYTYSGYDIGFYFGKNDITIQFRENETISNAIIEVCRRVEVKPGHIEDINEIIQAIYRKMTAADVLKDIYKKLFTYPTQTKVLEKEVGKDNEKKNNTKVINKYPDLFYFDCKNGKLNFNRYGETSEDLKSYLTYLADHEFFDYIQDFKISSSMEDLKNRVELFVKDSPNNKKNLPDFTKPANESIAKYGLLNHIEEVDKGRSVQEYNDFAGDLLDLLNNESESITFSILGDYKLRKGLIVRIENEKLKLNAQYDILSSHHTIDATSELVKLTIRQSSL